MSNELFAFLLTLGAGLATAVGSALAFFTKRTSPGFLSGALGFSAGVMLWVSFVEILPTAEATLRAERGTSSEWLAVGAFFLGIGIIAAIDFFVPDISNPHEFHEPEDFLSNPGEPEIVLRKESNKLMRMGLFTALALAIHNFPEGFATFLAGMQEVELAIPVAVAIAIHNIPEGIAVSVPIYYATGSRRKAFGLSAASGFAEPLGALLGYFLLQPILSETIFGIVFAAVGGVMVYISLDELLPSAEQFGKHHVAISGLISGMGVMALSLLLL